MTSIYTNVLSSEELYYLNNHPKVLVAKASIDAKSSGMVYFSLPITDSIRNTLQTRFGLHISTGSTIPMRWIKGDTIPHVDVGLSDFQNTYLLYLNDSPGELVLDSQVYPIQANNGFVFNEGLSHETQNTGIVPRLLLGPMNELADPVGVPPIAGIAYFPTEADALALDFANILGFETSYVVGDGGPFGPGGGYTSWIISTNSTGTSPQNVVYANGTLLNPDGTYYLYPYIAPIQIPISNLIAPQTVGPASIPTKQNLPNNQSNAVMGMPFKPPQMTQGNFLAMSRAAYNRNVNLNVNAIDNPGLGVPQKKKWYGASSSRTCAEHTNLRGIEATGKGTTNQLVPQQTFSFSGPDQTTVKTALARCRGNGGVAPKKKGAMH